MPLHDGREQKIRENATERPGARAVAPRSPSSSCCSWSSSPAWLWAPWNAVTRRPRRRWELRLDRLTRLMARPVPYEGGTLPLAVSIGAATPAASRTVTCPL